MTVRRVIKLWMSAGALLCLSACEQPVPPDGPVKSAIVEPAPNVAATPIPTGEGQRLALLIGNANYSVDGWKLDMPLQDVAKIKTALLESGFTEENVIVVADGKTAEMRAAIGRFVAKLRDGGATSVGFVYYAGHGASAVRAGLSNNYLIPIDVAPQSNDELAFVGVSVDEILGELSTVEAKAIFFIADSCRNPAFIGVSSGARKASIASNPAVSVSAPASTGATATRSLAVPGSRGMVTPYIKGHTFIAYATGEGQTAPDDGLFATVLAKYIAQPGLRASEALSETLVEVGEARGQRPFMSPGRSGDFCFNSCKMPQPLSDAAGEEVSWSAFSKEGSREALTLFLRSYPNGTRAAEAKQRLAALDPVAVAPPVLPAPTLAEPTTRSLIAHVREKSICDAYNVIGAATWGKEFHKPTVKGTWHVFVESLGASGSTADAMDARDKWRQRFPNVEFGLMPTFNANSMGNRQYAIVIAEGQDRAQATEIVRFAKECGIAAGAYMYQQTI